MAEARAASYFPSIEKKNGRSIAERQQVIAGCGLDKHMAIVTIGLHLWRCNALLGILAGTAASVVLASTLLTH